MTTTIDGVPWLEAKPFGEDGPNYQQWIANVLAPLSREQGYCLCYHPFSDMIKFDGLGCGFCEQQVTEQSNGPEAKALRTQATRLAFPELWRTE